MLVIETDALVIADAEGHYYVLARDIIDQARIPDEDREIIDERIGADTIGFASLGLGFSLVGPLRAELD